ncbi:MAG: carboxypeptidase-like regulatory domain-containing protein [Crocinitomicaceae bacterium]|nr:carboxypeptidase-like regulatory domain-containing protein [Crocinitomicaceae bacterium]
MRNLSLFSLILFLAVSCGKVSVQGRVVNPITGEGIEGVKLSIVKSSGGLPAGEKTITSTFTGSDGSYSLSIKSMKAVYLQINTFGKYHPIGWYENGKYAGGNHYALKKKKMLVDFHAVPYGEILTSIHNINCQGPTDTLVFKREYISYSGMSVFEPFELTGCYNNAGTFAKVPSGNYRLEWIVIRGGQENVYSHVLFVPPNGQASYNIDY